MNKLIGLWIFTTGDFHGHFDRAIIEITIILHATHDFVPISAACHRTDIILAEFTVPTGLGNAIHVGSGKHLIDIIIGTDRDLTDVLTEERFRFEKIFLSLIETYKNDRMEY